MKKLVALALAVLFVLSMSSVAFAAVSSPVGSTVVGGTVASGGGASAIVTSAREMAAIKKSVAEQVGVEEGAITNYASAKVDVGTYKGETYPVKLNMPATLNGQTVKIAVLLKDGTWKIMTAVVENGLVTFDAPIVDGFVKFMVYTDKIQG